MLVEKEWKTKKKIKKNMKKVGHFPTIFDKRKERQKPEQEEKTEARKRKKRQKPTKIEASCKSHF